MIAQLALALVLVLSALLGPAAAPIAARAPQLLAAAQAAPYTLSISKSPDRSSAGALNGQTVSGNVYVFVTPDTGASQVRFYLDNPSGTGTAVQTENNAPHDFAGGSAGSANAYDTSRLSNGTHTITAAIDLAAGGTTLVTATFVVANGVAPTPVPPTATAAPTATAVPPTVAPQPSYSNLVSTSTNRSGAVALQGRTVSSTIYVFVTPESGVSQARFFVDNPSGSGTPTQTENSAPWDLAGGSATAANAYDTRKLANGAHSITVSITLASGATVVTTSTFNVSNASATNTAAPTATAVPTATPTKAPTTVPQSSFNHMMSKSADRSGAYALTGQTVNGSIYVFVSPATGASQVNFYLDNPTASGTPYRSEGNAPWDLAGGNTTTANALDTRTMSNGAHSVTASITLTSGAKVLTTASFNVNNTSVPAPTQTPVPGPTATPPAPGTGGIYWGVNMSGVPGDMTRLAAWERDVTGKPVSIVHWVNFWGDSAGNYRNWSNTAVNNARAHGAIPMISWTPEGGDPGKWQLGDILNGSHDGYIRQWASDAKAWGQPFFLRIMHEMNGSWGYPWQETQNGNSRGQFVAAWRRIVDIFRQVGVSNASYVWCPNIDYPNTSNPSFASLYPGDSYVDWTCLDGYNWGTNRSSGWQSFDQVYNYSYNEILKFAPAKPMMIGEFGSVEQGGSKAAWLSDALTTQIPSRYPKVRAAVYFNWQFDGVDWRLETSAAATDAWRRGIASAYYAPNRFGAITGKPAVP